MSSSTCSLLSQVQCNRGAEAVNKAPFRCVFGYNKKILEQYRSKQFYIQYNDRTAGSFPVSGNKRGYILKESLLKRLHSISPWLCNSCIHASLLNHNTEMVGDS